MIISASRRTDIPAFYSEWFMNRIRNEYFYKVNPFNKNQVKGISLAPKDVDAIVFWSKQPKPMLPHLKELNEKGYNYYFQYTMNNYPEILEPNLPELSKRIEVFKKLSSQTSPKQVVWRYDPIIHSSITPIDFHLEKFDYIASEICNYTERVVISFLDIYGKTKRKLKKLQKNNDIEFKDIVEYNDKLIKISTEIKKIANNYGLEIESCGELDNDSAKIIKPGACIDKDLINDLFDLNLEVKKDKNQRSQCLCVNSEDMGSYDTCKFACTYCYANNSQKAVNNKTKKHNPESSVLIGECDKNFYKQDSLF
ncbi:MAG: DUF1848 domain-containing protein [bacterium]